MERNPRVLIRLGLAAAVAALLALASGPLLPAAAQETETPAGEQPAAKKIVVPTGTRLPLVLHNSISTRSAKPGDPVYLEVLFPILIDGKIVIPAGSYVQGEVTEAKRPGRVKGRAELGIRINTMILPNGYSVDFRAFPIVAGTGGNEEADSEGRIKGDTDKTSDVITVGTTASIGTGVGAAIGRSGKGSAIGAGIGAATGLAAVLLSRGPEAELPRGTTLDVELDRNVTLDAEKAIFTDPGQASTLAGPSGRQRQRRSFPY
jgi:type IV secretion system protein VirB10